MFTLWQTIGIGLGSGIVGGTLGVFLVAMLFANDSD